MHLHLGQAWFGLEITKLNSPNRNEQILCQSTNQLPIADGQLDNRCIVLLLYRYIYIGYIPVVIFREIKTRIRNLVQCSSLQGQIEASFLRTLIFPNELSSNIYIYIYIHQGIGVNERWQRQTMITIRLTMVRLCEFIWIMNRIYSFSL